MIKVDAVLNGVAAYAERELLPQLDGLHRFAAAVYIGMLMSDVNSTAAAISQHPLLLVPGLSTTDGYVDIDKAYNAVRDYISKTPLEVNITKAKVKLTFRLPDVDKLYAYIKEYSDER